VLIVLTPGVERFEYLRHLVRIRNGDATRESLIAEQERYDTHFLNSPTWRHERATGHRRC
jgi:hypothetical protein